MKCVERQDEDWRRKKRKFMHQFKPSNTFWLSQLLIYPLNIRRKRRERARQATNLHVVRPNTMCKTFNADTSQFQWVWQQLFSSKNNYRLLSEKMCNNWNHKVKISQSFMNKFVRVSLFTVGSFSSIATYSFGPLSAYFTSIELILHKKANRQRTFLHFVCLLICIFTIESFKSGLSLSLFVSFVEVNENRVIEIQTMMTATTIPSVWLCALCVVSYWDRWLNNVTAVHKFKNERKTREITIQRANTHLGLNRICVSLEMR